ncbi:MAG TPA: nucleotidyltransferase family protein [Longimicrobiaceae bacterium]|nr:nucleotidyltransferase family protein [Longimicrobiaceae bacterium]
MSSQHDAPVLLERLDAHLTNPQRRVLVRWATELLRIRRTTAPPLRKAKAALDATYRAEVVVPILRGAGQGLADVAWRDRGWAARLGLGAAAVTALTRGGQGAGIAALGGAVGVPLWIVLGSGGAFAGMLVDELQRSIRRHEPPGGAPRPEEIEEAEYEVLPPDDPPPLLAGPPAAPDASPAPLWQHFRRAYREARVRQKQSARVEFPRDRLAEFCRRHGIRKLAVFGSVLRDDFGPESDIDVLVEFEEGRTPGFEFVALQDELSALLGREVDLNTPNSLSRYFRDAVTREAEVLYAA